MSRLGRNHGGYRGETVLVEQVVADAVRAARQHGWTIEELCVRPGLSLYGLYRRVSGGPPGPGASELPAGRATRPLPPGSRRVSEPARVYVSAGIHGDEPAGPLAVQRLVSEDAWPRGMELWLCPCLNPAGFRDNRRENADGRDLNRDFRTKQSAEVRAHTEWLERQPSFDLAICLHEDWEASGFYLYELNPEARPSPAEAVVREVAPVCPIDLSPVIEGRAARDGVIRPLLNLRERPDWPEAFHLIQNKTRHSFTLEAPSDFPMATRVAALTRAVTVLLNWLGKDGV